MVIGHLGIVDKPRSEWLLARARNQVLAEGRLNDLDDPRQCVRHVLREMPAVRAWITDQFVALIERLRDIERFLGAKTEKAVRVPLEFRKIILYPLNKGR